MPSRWRRRTDLAVAVLSAPFASAEYFTRWSLLMSFVISTFLSVPSVGIPSFDGYLRGVAVAAIGWVPLALLGLVAAYAERRLAKTAAERVAVVIATLVGLSAIRPFLNDAISAGLFGLTTGGNWTARITTNVVTAGILFTVCAVAVTYHRQLRATTRRLRQASALMRVGTAEAAHLQAKVPDILAQIADDPHVKAREMIAAYPDAEMGTVPMHCVVPRLSATPGSIRRPAPALGEHNAEILGALGLDARELARLAAAGIIGSGKPGAGRKAVPASQQ